MSKPIKHGKKWQVRWVDEDGKRRGEVYDDYQDAVFAMKAHRNEVAEIKRGFRVRPPKDRTFEELTQKWTEVRVVTKKNPKDDLSIIRARLKPAFGELTLRQITAERIAEFTAEMGSKRAPKTVSNALTLLGSMLRVAVEWGWIDSVPKIRKPRIRMFNREYRWLRTADEIDRFLTAAKDESEWPVVFPMYATAIYTGMRAGELAGLKWSDVSFERRLITVQRSFSGTTKSGDVRHVPIVDRLLPVLKAWKLASGSKSIVFPNAEGKMWDQSGRIFQEMLKRVLIRAGFDARYVHFHGLRHTFASHWVLNGGDLFRLQKVLGHHDSQMTQRYAHLSPAAYESDWGRFGKADEPKKGEVIELAHVKE